MIKIIDISDIHMGHPNISPYNLHKSFKTLLYPRLKDIDILFISGDFFHSLITMNNDWAVFIHTIIIELRNLAIINNFIIRVMRGTFSHDNHQLRLFSNEHNEFKLDNEPVKIIEKLELEYIEKLNIWVLYKPDDLVYENSMEAIISLLHTQHIDKVDIVINHGYFEHQVPPQIAYKPHGMLNLNTLSSYVTGVIFNGHIHTPSVHESFINVGSYDRTAHGEEEDKGYFIVEYDKSNNKITYEFVKNTYANIFKTCDLLSYNDEDAISIFIRFLDNLPNINRTMYIRTLSNSTILPTVLKEQCGKHKYDIKYKNEKKELKNNVTKEDLSFKYIELPKLNETNIYKHLITFIDDKYNITLDEKDIKTVI